MNLNSQQIKWWMTKSKRKKLKKKIEIDLGLSKPIHEWILKNTSFEWIKHNIFLSSGLCEYQTKSIT
jgi:hypothetical protein